MDPIFVQKTAVATTGLVPDEPAGTFTALVSVFGNKDRQGDIVMPGSFKKSLAAWVKKGRPIPAVWSHQFNNPEMFLGKYLDHDETEQGLLLKGRLNLRWDMARKVHELYEEGLVTEFSWSGRVEDFDEIGEKDDDYDEEEPWRNGVRIKAVDLWEAGPTFKGANPATELLGVKSLQALQSEYLKTVQEVRSKSQEGETGGEGTETEKPQVKDPADPTLTDVNPGDGEQARKAAELSPSTRALLALFATE